MIVVPGLWSQSEMPGTTLKNKRIRIHKAIGTSAATGLGGLPLDKVVMLLFSSLMLLTVRHFPVSTERASLLRSLLLLLQMPFHTRECALQHEGASSALYGEGFVT